MARSADPRLRQWWRELIDSFDVTRGTVGEFCRRHEVSTASFYRWRAKLATFTAAELRQPAQDQAPVDSTAFVPLQILHAEADGGSRSVQVHLPGGVSIEMPVDQKELLFELVAQLRGQLRDQPRIDTAEAGR